MDGGVGPDRGRQTRSRSIIDFEEIIRNSDVVNDVQSRETRTNNNCQTSNDGVSKKCSRRMLDIVCTKFGSFESKTIFQNFYPNDAENCVMAGNNEPLVHFDNNLLNYANPLPQNYEMTRLA